MKSFGKHLPLVLAFGLGCSGMYAQGYKVKGSIAIGGSGGWDYLAADAPNRKLYVSHGTQVEVVDLHSNKPAGKIPGFGGVHGIAFADKLGKGFISDGRSNEVAIFDLKTMTVRKKVKAGTNPDGIVYDPFSQRVFAFNGRSKDATAIDAKSDSVVGTIALDGKPEFPVSDGKGHVYANIEDKSEIVKIDPKTLKVEGNWPLSPCESPSGLAINQDGTRLFAVCDNKLMAVVDARNGKVVATPAIGDGPDAAGYDANAKLAFSSNGDGTLTVIQDKGSDQYPVVETVTTEKGARTMTIDEKTGNIYLSAAKYGPAPAATASNAHPRPAVLPGSFKVLIVAKQ
jgi:DNA-binding beta-propeller fold protein YncE